MADHRKAVRSAKGVVRATTQKNKQNKKKTLMWSKQKIGFQCLTKYIKGAKL